MLYILFNNNNNIYKEFIIIFLYNNGKLYEKTEVFIVICYYY